MKLTRTDLLYLALLGAWCYATKQLASPRRISLCVYCGRPSVAGEGPQVCRACIYRYGRCAGFPDRLTPEERHTLLTVHGSAVEFVVKEGKGYWKWTDNWPSDNSTLISR